MFWVSNKVHLAIVHGLFRVMHKVKSVLRSRVLHWFVFNFFNTLHPHYSLNSLSGGFCKANYYSQLSQQDKVTALYKGTSEAIGFCGGRAFVTYTGVTLKQL